MSADRRPSKDELTQQLSDMFQTIQSQPVPDRILSVVDQLDGDAESTAPPAAPRAATGG
ncbi:MAG: hypothetical protein Q7S93_11875 [Phenylobacterium sp.]|uniref:hypothetical protein n=1 Tax=Phenylobacterium sp. TaxID=1871053 RepID=UPI002727D5FC|nr:hypothetical protein [Phenylobacterium sp.]MDO8410743.1 hypothetical protein [Phenylobacterium sp.]